MHRAWIVGGTAIALLGAAIIGAARAAVARIERNPDPLPYDRLAR
ncbi:hypothetical protein [Couchioplanes azureus]|nr:hypothetical protein [Couchioplanes caeruleus]GGQ86570.1 hypothetical protein GCM10010166_65860 [Couchioplanes caeruleus subsp. azureus]